MESRQAGSIGCNERHRLEQLENALDAWSRLARGGRAKAASGSEENVLIGELARWAGTVEQSDVFQLIVMAHEGAGHEADPEWTLAEDAWLLEQFVTLRARGRETSGISMPRRSSQGLRSEVQTRLFSLRSALKKELRAASRDHREL